MINQNIQIVRLGPMRMVCVNAFGVNPEEEAWSKLYAWAETHRLLNNPNKHPIFGFRNYLSTESGTRYGYEYRMKLVCEIAPGEAMRMEDFPGGPYAVTRCKLVCMADEQRADRWQYLDNWCKHQNIRKGYHPALEKLVTPKELLTGIVLDLYYPIIY